jgi:hypothetical protein
MNYEAADGDWRVPHVIPVGAHRFRFRPSRADPGPLLEQPRERIQDLVEPAANLGYVRPAEPRIVTGATVTRIQLAASHQVEPHQVDVVRMREPHTPGSSAA